MTRLKFLILPAALMLVGAATGAAEEIAFPDGYRGWTHIRSAVVGPTSGAFKRFGGMHSIYANPAAMDGYRSGHFTDGSVIVFDNHETLAAQGAEFPGRRRFIDVMMKTNGSWRFNEFAGDSRTVRSVTVAQGEAQCASCHAQSPTDHVYSQYAP
jgi:hypothetical protein